MSSFNYFPSFFDKYEMKARLAPAILMLLPLVLPLRVALSPEAIGWAETLVIAIPVLYAFTLLVAMLGRRVEPRLWKKWDGPPSTRFCRWRDEQMGKQRKTLLHAAVAQHLQIELYSPQKERARPDESDRIIADTFRQVKEILRRRDPTGLWSIHNANYGFARNTLASATWGGILSLIAAIVCGCIWLQTDDRMVFAGVWVAIGLAAIFLVCRLWIMPTVAKLHADRYAECAWETFLVITSANQAVSQPASTPKQASELPVESPSTPT
jgi:hypothetical protein